MKKQQARRKEALGNSLLVLLRKEPLEKIVKYTGLSEEEINNLTVE